jgi:hypothetical protein
VPAHSPARVLLAGARRDDRAGAPIGHGPEDDAVDDLGAVARSLDAQVDACVAQVTALHTLLSAPGAAQGDLLRAAAAAQAGCEQVDADAARLAVGRR